MSTAEEIGDSTRVGMEKTLSRNGDTVAAPVDLDELGELTLRSESISPARARKPWNAHIWILDTSDRILHAVLLLVPNSRQHKRVALTGRQRTLPEVLQDLHLRLPGP